MVLFSTIMTLFKPGCPLAVFFRVGTIVIYTLKCKAYGWLSHIFKKVFKVMPFITNIYSTSAIVLVRSCLFIIAPLQHGTPNHINFGSGHAVGLHPNDMVPASTGFGRSTGEALPEDRPNLSTITFAQILYLIVSIVFNTVQHLNHKKSFSGKVDGFHVFNYRHFNI
jgi:hypothetical protein